MKETLPPLTNAKRALLQRYLQRERIPEVDSSSSIPPRDRQERLPLSYEQEQVWLHAQLASDLPLYNEPVTIIHRGHLSVSVLERSLNEILRRHEAWRTAIRVTEGQPVQVVAEELTVSLTPLDLRHLAPGDREAEALRLATEDAIKPLDLATAPLFRTRLIQFSDAEHRLYLVLSHIIFDGISIYRVFLPELATLYREFSADRPSPLAELTFQYPDYARWQRRERETARLSRDLEYWKQQLASEIAVLSLPIDRPRTAAPTFRGAVYPFRLNGQLTRRLKDLSQTEGVTLFQTLLAAFAVLLHRYSGQTDIPIGTVTGGRRHPRTQAMLGCFLNTVLLRLDLSGNPSFRQLVVRTRNVALEALDHDSVSFGQLVRDLKIQRDLSVNPLFQVMFTLEPSLPNLGAAWGLSQADVDTGTTKYDLYLELEERDNETIARMRYSLDLFDAPTITRMAAHWQTLLEAAAVKPRQSVSALPLLTDQELHQQQAWNATQTPYPSVATHRLFEAQVRKSPDAPAVIFRNKQLTYAALNARANRLARDLRKCGVRRETLVGLCAERSLEMVVALLAIWKAGGAYVPLDPNYPAERLALVMASAKPHVLLTQSSLQQRFPSNETPVVLLDKQENKLSPENYENLDDDAGPGDLAYVIYTSGSTGTPKGVQIEHRNLVNFLCSMQQQPGMNHNDVLLAVTTLSFDIAGLEIYLPLISGARLVVAPQDVVADGTALKALLEQSQTTVMQATPATWRLLIGAGWRGSSKLKILCGGEALAPELGAELARRSRSTWNLYGPTETTVWSTIYPVSGENKDGVPIGRPISNTQLYVLDAQMNRLPVGIAGSLYIGGDGLARGYQNSPSLTEERFLSDSFAPERGARIYKTGDVARYLPNGDLEFLGRSDDQVKIRGYRIELGDIETALSTHPAVKTAVVVAREDNHGDKQLVACVIGHEGRTVSPKELREHVKQKLPEYMVPTHCIFMAGYPLTPNGKVDRRALQASDIANNRGETTFVAGRDEVELQLAEIWQNVLGAKVGVHDDFFDAGGHSLSAVRLFALIEKAFGRKLPLSTLYKAPTIERLADLLRDTGPSNSWVSLVRIQVKGSAPPLFCIHGHYGDVLFCRRLSHHLGEGRPFFALQARGVTGLPAHDSIEGMASDYLREVRSVQPHGPYLLSGYCFGARVALEMAHQLREQGEEVAFLGFLIDYDSEVDFTGTQKSRIRSHLEQLQQMGVRLKLFSVRTNLAAKMRSLRWRVMFRLVGRRLPAASPLLRDVSEMHLRAVRNYVPKYYPGRITVFAGGPVSADIPVNRQLNLYGMQAHQTDVHVVPRDRNMTMIDEPFVQILARQLNTCLSRAHESPGVQLGA